MHFLFLLATRCFILLNNTATNSSTCTKNDPCGFLSKSFNENYRNFTDIQIVENEIVDDKISIFINITLFCSTHGINLCGLNQTISLSSKTNKQQNQTYIIKLKNTKRFNIENFTFTDIEYPWIHCENGKVNFDGIYFTHSKSQILEIDEDSSVKFSSCCFLSNFVNSKHLVNINNSFVVFTNCTFDSISKSPLSYNSIIKVTDSSVNLDSCSIVSAYHNYAFFESHSSEFTVTNFTSTKNCGSFLFRGFGNSTLVFQFSIFIENSCMLFYLENSLIDSTNLTIQQNCINEPIFHILNDSSISFHDSFFNHNSCGPIANIYQSKVLIHDCLFSDNLSPTNLFYIDVNSNFYIKSSKLTNSTTIYGSIFYASHSHLNLNQIIFNSAFSRVCGSVLKLKETHFKGSHLSFSNIHSVEKGAICVESCIENGNKFYINDMESFDANDKDFYFEISDSEFLNNWSENQRSIYSNQCNGFISNSVFSETMEEEISRVLFDDCKNCTFKDPPETIEQEIIESKDNNFILLISLTIISLFLILFVMKRKILVSFRRITRKHHH
ncbi:hypothetical protein TRFO_05736 [Tritrichomonas foetus]|uniref:Right handed beta helix domain-containing protein n=1 Tax=Tritrichomonas foetus TaxID=1144522 RepID=A0A1J4K8N8_9EUKA|nr:hypothetical protein TRFO_05736 [Tritrichomonas foetus]|eukprot:OHT06076.1 hypothetical protein TRFO_05736 [Tritrichomonas foetus]